MDSKMRTPLIIVSIIILSIVFCRANVLRVPEEVENMVGVFKGEWKIFGVDPTGNVYEQMAWSDSAVACDPVVEDDRAYVTVIDYMIFPGHIPPQSVQWIEGCFVFDDGSAGDRFMEMDGRVTRMFEVGDNTWAYSTPADVNEIASLGFTNILSGQHDFIKVVRYHDGETHFVSRTTTVVWLNGSDQIQTTQWLSLQGFHKRIE